MRLNLPRRGKRRLPNRLKQPLDVVFEPNRAWSMDFVHDTLWCGRRFRTLNILDEGVREILAIEVDSSLPAERVIRVSEQLKENRPLPAQIRVDNGPELISSKLTAWCDIHNIKLHYIPTRETNSKRLYRAFQPHFQDGGSGCPSLQIHL